MSSMFLGIDCGTRGTKALLIDRDGKAHGTGYAPHELIERANGAREQNPDWWVTALRTSVEQALANTDPATVRAIGVSGQQHGLVILDEDMQVIRPAKLWNDTQTAPQNSEIIQRFGGRAEFFERFGILPLTGYTVSKLLWLAENEPANFARIRHVMLPHEYLNYWLTGQCRSEFGDASGTAFFDIRTRTWIREILDEIDGGSGMLFRALPQLVGVNDVVGTVRPQVAAEFGLSTNCIVSPGGGDNMMGAIGTGNVREGIVTLSLGTSSTVYSYRMSPTYDASGCVAPFCSSSGGWLPLVCTMNATNVVTQTVTLLGKTVQDIDAALLATKPGADGLIFLPFMNGERTPDLPAARGSLLGASATNFTPENLIRAAVEGVSFGILFGLDLILEGASPDRIRLIGGGARSAGWRQLLSDATGSIIEVPLEQEAGCLGAAMQAIFTVGHRNGHPETFMEIASRCVTLDDSGTSTPHPERLGLYRSAMQQYQEHLAKLYDV